METPGRKISDVTETELKNFNDMKKKILLHCADGFKDKTVLEIGTEIQYPHGGIYGVLALVEGAKLVFGIDITAPRNTCSNERKILFWKMLSKRMGGLDQIGHINKDCLRFISQDVMWDDNKYNKLTFLQMSASDMYFRDEMFDLIISNATFEHLKKPWEALKEMKRVLKQNGYIYLSWNPFTSLRMGGHDIGIPYYYPWAHLRLSKKEHIQKLREVYSNKKIYETMPIEHRSNDKLASQYAKYPENLLVTILQDLNQIRINEFLKMVNNLNLKIIYIYTPISKEERKYLTEQIRQELSEYSEKELLIICMQVILQKK